jgi:hypothetical protein
MTPDESDEMGQDDVPVVKQPIAGLDELNHSVLPAGSDGHHQPAAVGKLCRQRRRDAGKRRRDQDRVERRVFGQSFRAVTDDYGDVRSAMASEIFPGRLGDVGEPLDAPDFLSEASQQRGLPAIARSDLKYALRTGELECLDHPGHQRRLRRYLTMRDGQWRVTLGLVCEFRRDEGRPRHGTNGFQHMRILNTGEPAGVDEARLHVDSMRT